LAGVKSGYIKLIFAGRDEKAIGDLKMADVRKVAKTKQAVEETLERVKEGKDQAFQLLHQ